MIKHELNISYQRYLCFIVVMTIYMHPTSAVCAHQTKDKQMTGTVTEARSSITILCEDKTRLSLKNLA